MDLEQKAIEFVSLLRQIPTEVDDSSDIRADIPPGVSLSSYAHLYELSIHHLVVNLMRLMGLYDQLEDTVSHGDPNAQIFRFAREAEPEVDLSTDDSLAVLIALRVLVINLESITLHFMPVAGLLERVGKGDDEALFNAVRLDPALVSAKPMADRISGAAVVDDSAFKVRLSKALVGTKPPRPKDHLDELRLLMQFLDDAGELDGMSDATLTDWAVNRVGVISDSGDPFQVVRRQRRKRDQALGSVKTRS